MQQPTPSKLVSQVLVQEPDLRDVVAEFVAGLAKRVTEIQQAFDRLDWDRLTTLAHRLKGAGGSYGYPEIGKVCAEMEQSFRTHHAGEYEAWVRKLAELTKAAEAGLEGT